MNQLSVRACLGSGVLLFVATLLLTPWRATVQTVPTAGVVEPVVLPPQTRHGSAPDDGAVQASSPTKTSQITTTSTTPTTSRNAKPTTTAKSVWKVSAATSTTRGRFHDDFDTGNDDDDTAAVAALLPPLGSVADEAAEEAGEVRRDGSDIRHWGRMSEPRQTADKAGSSITTTTTTTWVRVGETKASPDCYYLVRDFCVLGGSLVFYVTAANQRQLLKDGFGALRLCNELRGKVPLRFSVVEATPATSAAFRQRLLGNEKDSTAHVAVCWQFYGYHLFQCLAAMDAAVRRHGFSYPFGHVWLYNHAQSFPAAVRNHYSHATFIGSRRNWSDPNPEGAALLGHRRNPYWRLWSLPAGADHPDAVSELRKFPFAGAHPDVCFRRGIIGQPNHNNVSGRARRRHVRALRERLGEFASSPAAPRMLLDPDEAAARCGGDTSIKPPTTATSSRSRNHTLAFSLVIAQRDPRSSAVQGARCLANVEEIVKSVLLLRHNNNGSGDVVVVVWNVTVVDWARLSLEDQVRVASSADVLLSSHGAGNTWLALQPPRSVFIEAWAGCLERNVYVAMAKQYNVRYYALCNRAAGGGGAKKDSNFLHGDVTVSTARLANVLGDAAQFLLAVRSFRVERFRALCSSLLLKQ